MMSFGFLRSPFDDSPVWRHDFHSPWTYSPRFCSVHGPAGFCGGHRRKAKPQARDYDEVRNNFEAPLRRKVNSTRENTSCRPEEQTPESAEVTNYLEAPLGREVNSDREKNTTCRPEEKPLENEEDCEENVLESGGMDEEPIAELQTLDLPANDVDTETPQNTEGGFEPAVESPRESEDVTDEAEVEEKLEVIQGQLSKARELVPRLEAFSGNGKERLYLEEHLTRCILELDKVEANGSDVIKSNRKAVIKEIESLLSNLDGR